jgi:hypothetical protein
MFLLRDLPFCRALGSGSRVRVLYRRFVRRTVARRFAARPYGQNRIREDRHKLR